MISELCKICNNYFPKGKYYGNFSISGGSIAPLDFLQDGQYFRIIGSVFNDGVYKYPADNLKDEVFSGSVWAMGVPPAFIALADEIKAYCESDTAANSPYTSESFGGYSYTKATDSNGAPLTWQNVFASRINQYRRIGVV